MADEKVYTQETIQENPLPITEGVVSFSESSSSSKETYSQSTVKEQSIPTKKIAVELIGSALNTKSRKILQEFQFTQMGAIQIGKYESGVSGDLRLSPNGIVARNSSGLTTFAIDGDTGNAVFAGTVQAGTLISGAVVVGDNTIVIDGENKRIIVNDGTVDRILIGLG